MAGELPRLPFADGEFDLTLVSHLLFAYQDRIYPTVTFEAHPSEYIPLLKSDPALEAFEFKEIETDFEFLVDSNSYLKVNWKKIN